ncbi:MAG: S8 family serine peptidase [Bacteroidota bacterium]
MTKCKTILFPPLLAWLFTAVSLLPLCAQTNATFSNQDHQKPLRQSFQQFSQQPIFSHRELVAGHYYRQLTFKDVPSPEAIRSLEEAGIILQEYLGQNVYRASISADASLQQLPAEGFEEIARRLPTDKVAPTLFEHPSQPSQRIDLLLQYQSDLNEGLIRYLLQKMQVEIKGSNPHIQLLHISAEARYVEQLSQLPGVRYIEDYPQTVETEDLPATYGHRANLINRQSGKKLLGKGVHVAIADDGFIGPHIDFKGRTIQDAISGAADGSHGEVVAGILTGAGNLDPSKQGFAPAATLHVLNTFDPIDFNTNIGIDNRIVITSNSYGVGCNRGYTIFAQSIDRKTRVEDDVLHVFSAGNAGLQDCGFGAGIGWGTITGGSKMGKNVIAVGNVDHADQIVATSSRGPASDGRIKPDICANGDGQLSTAPNNRYVTSMGSSAAAPVISGIAAQLYEAYRSANNGQNPPSALIKAALLNTAEDLGPKGPDFSYGWGRVNGKRALELIQNGQYIRSSIGQNETQSFQIDVPQDAESVRFMVYWHDLEASPSAELALVNDLDMVVQNANGRSSYPWVLSPQATSGQFFEPATEGNDHLNNVEQVEIQRPNSTVYTVEISGYSVPKGPQEYYLLYEIQEKAIELIHPIGGEQLTPGQATRIHWDAKDPRDVITVEFSDNDGQSWSILGLVADGTRHFDWEVPSVENGQGMIRVRSSKGSSQSQSNFDLVPIPDNFRILKVCPDFVRLGWNALENAQSYIIYGLGGKYMDSLLTVTSNVADVPISSSSVQNWYAVQAVYANGARSQRSTAVFDLHQLTDCTAQNDLSITGIQGPSYPVLTSCPADIPLVDVVIQNKGSSRQRDFWVHYQLDEQEVVSEQYEGSLPGGITVNFQFALPLLVEQSGRHHLKAWVSLSQDEARYNDTIHFNFVQLDGPMEKLPYFENFDEFDNCDSEAACNTSCPLDKGWINLSNQSEDLTDWRVHNGMTPSYGTGPATDQNTATQRGRYLYLESSNNCHKKEAVLISPCFDLSGLTQPVLTFWYHMQGQDVGELRVSIFNGQRWALLVQPLQGEQGKNWRNLEIDLKAYVGQKVNIRFSATTGAGFLSDIAIDNVGLFDKNSPPVTHFNMSSTKGCPQNPIRFYDNSFNSPNHWHWSFEPSNVSFLDGTSDSSANPIVLFHEAGDYQVKLYTSNDFGEDSLQTAADLIQLSDGQSLPTGEDFNAYNEGHLSPWQIVNPDDNITWSYVEVIGSDGLSSPAISVNNHSYSSVSEQDQIVSYSIDLVDATNPQLRFDLSYAASNHASDHLLVEIIDQCNPEQTELLYHKTGRNLSTVSRQNRGWQPTAPHHWRTETVSLESFIGTSVILKFINICGYGNNIYLDNIVIAESKDLPTSQFRIIPEEDPSYCVGDTIELVNISSLGEPGNLYTWFIENNGNRLILSETDPKPLSLVGTGKYTIGLLVKNEVGRELTHQSIQVLAEPQALFSFTQQDDGTVFFTNESIGAESFWWDFGDGHTSTETHPTHRYNNTDRYTVQLKTSNECSSSTSSIDIRVLSSIQTAPQNKSLTLFPNPSQQFVNIRLPQNDPSALFLQLFDLKGQLLSSQASLQAKSDGTYQLSLDHLSQGTYLLHVVSEEGISYTSKVVFIPQ